MRSFLSQIKRVSNEYRNDAVKIEQLHSELKFQYRDLQQNANEKVFRPEKAKSSAQIRNSYNTAPSKMSRRSKPTSRSFSRDFWIIHDNQKLPGSPTKSPPKSPGRSLNPNLDKSAPTIHSSKPSSPQKAVELSIDPSKVDI